MTSFVLFCQSIDRMSLAEKEFLAWYAGKEFSKEKRDLLQVDAFVADEMNRYPAPPELLQENKGRRGLGRQKDPNSLRGLIEGFVTEKQNVTKSELRGFLLSKRPDLSEQHLLGQLTKMKNVLSRTGWGDATVFTIKAA